MKFAIDNISFVEEEESDSQFATVKIDVFASGNNHHELFVSEEALRRTSDTIKEKPLIFVYDEILDDAGAHDEDLYFPGGFVPKEQEIEFRNLDDGRVMMSVVGKIWKEYCGRLLEFFKRDSKTKPVSVEMKVFDFGSREIQEGKHIPEILDYAYTAITVLGSFVAPAIPGAKADLVAFAKEETVEYEKAYDAEFSVDTVDSKLGLELYEGYKWAQRMAALFDEADEKQLIAHFKNLELSDDSKKNEKEMSMDEKDKKVLTPEGDEVIIVMAVDDETPEDVESENQDFQADDDGGDDIPATEVLDNPSEEKSFSAFALDVQAALEFLKEDSEDYQKFVSALEKPEEERDYATACEYVYNRMYSLNDKMVEMAQESSVYMAELEGLRQYKAEMEEKDFAFAVNTTLKEVEGIVPEVEMDVLREDSKNFDLQNIDGWKNAVKAKAFSYTKKLSENSDIPKVGLPWLNGDKKDNSNPW